MSLCCFASPRSSWGAVFRGVVSSWLCLAHASHALSDHQRPLHLPILISHLLSPRVVKVTENPVLRTKSYACLTGISHQASESLDEEMNRLTKFSFTEITNRQNSVRYCAKQRVLIQQGICWQIMDHRTWCVNRTWIKLSLSSDYRHPPVAYIHPLVPLGNVAQKGQQRDSSDLFESSCSCSQVILTL